MGKNIKTVGIVSLSSGALGEEALRHELELGVSRLRGMGLQVKFTDNALRGAQALKEHPEARAADLLQAFRDEEIDLILCAIGGDDTYRLLPYLFEGDALQKAVCQKPFLGFSDTTINHLMLHKVGVNTFYGQSFLSDICELAPTMLPYTERYFRELIETGTIREVTPADVWYESRGYYSAAELGKELVSHPNGGFELLQGAPVFRGKILGGCLDSLFDLFDPGRYADSPVLAARYGLFPPLSDWRGRILLLETSEEKMTPAQYRHELETLKRTGVFGVVSGILAGKPMDECCADEYRAILTDVIADPALPVVWNVNIGHAMPRCILPFGVEATVDAAGQRITFAV